MQAVVVGPPRVQADVKDTNWVTLRRPLAEKVPDDAAEGLLQDDRGRLLEGLVTNLLLVRTHLPPSRRTFLGHPYHLHGNFNDLATSYWVVDRFI